MVRVKCYSATTRDIGIITCEEIIFGYKLAHVFGIKDIEGAVDIVNIVHHTKTIMFSLNFADINWIKSA